jgi:two-component system, chemotaxis family, chemotaxis protein CheY
MKKVLLVDESRSIRSVYAEVIQQAGFEAIAVSDAKAALQHIVEHGTPSLIVTEVNLPGISGLELCKRVRAVSKDLPFLIMSAQSDKDLIAVAKSMDIQGWLLKPVEPEYFLNKLNAVLGPVQTLSS